MNNNSRNGIVVRYAVVLVDTDLRNGAMNQTDLQYFDECRDAELWIGAHGSQYGQNLENNISRFFRVEKRFYIG